MVIIKRFISAVLTALLVLQAAFPAGIAAAEELPATTALALEQLTGGGH